MPYYVAMLNFFIQFSVYMVVFFAMLIIDFTMVPNPLYFIVSVIIVHLILMSFAKKEPQLAKIVHAKINVFKQRIPNRLEV